MLHICCGVCAGSVVPRLRARGFEVWGLFYNPNIYPLEEYTQRLKTARETARILEFPLLEGSYDNGNWFKKANGLANEAEGGKRCKICFRMRLAETRARSGEMNIPLFTTTLTVSPHKNSSVINDLGRFLSRKNFLAYDFKKEDGFKEATVFAKKHGLYRQRYCGCRYSMR